MVVFSTWLDLNMDVLPVLKGMLIYLLYRKKSIDLQNPQTFLQPTRIQKLLPETVPLICLTSTEQRGELYYMLLVAVLNSHTFHHYLIYNFALLFCFRNKIVFTILILGNHCHWTKSYFSDYSNLNLVGRENLKKFQQRYYQVS